MLSKGNSITRETTVIPPVGTFGVRADRGWQGLRASCLRPPSALLSATECELAGTQRRPPMDEREAERGHTAEGRRKWRQVQQHNISHTVIYERFL